MFDSDIQLVYFPQTQLYLLGVCLNNLPESFKQLLIVFLCFLEFSFQITFNFLGKSLMSEFELRKRITKDVELVNELGLFMFLFSRERRELIYPECNRLYFRVNLRSEMRLQSLQLLTKSVCQSSKHLLYSLNLLLQLDWRLLILFLILRQNNDIILHSILKVLNSISNLAKLRSDINRCLNVMVHFYLNFLTRWVSGSQILKPLLRHLWI